MVAFNTAKWFGIVTMIAGSIATDGAQAQPAASSVGPGRIFCSSAASCELDIGSPASLKYTIDPSALAEADKDRLVKQCTAEGTPCVATVTGTETESGVK